MTRMQLVQVAVPVLFLAVYGCCAFAVGGMTGLRVRFYRWRMRHELIQAAKEIESFSE